MGMNILNFVDKSIMKFWEIKTLYDKRWIEWIFDLVKKKAISV